MVSFQTPGDNPAAPPASRPPQSPSPRPGSTQPRNDDLGSAAQTGIESKQPEQMDQIPSILRPGGKSPNLNPFRHREGSSTPTAPGQIPTEALSKMHLESATNNPWSSALYTQRTGTPGSETARSRQPTPTPPPPAAVPAEFQQDPWVNQGPVELDATSYAHPSKPLSVPIPEEQSVWGSSDSQLMVNKSQAEDSQRTLLVKPATDEYSQIFDDQHAWDDLGRTPTVKRSETNKTAGEDSDQDDWNMIDSETSSLAGDAVEGATAKPTKPNELKAELKATGPLPVPGMGAPPIPIKNSPQVSYANISPAAAVLAPSPPFVDAPTTPWDEPKPYGSEKPKQGTKLEQEWQRTEEAPAPAQPPIIIQPKDDPKQDVLLLIEPTGYESASQSSQSRHEPQTGGLLPVQEEERPALPLRPTETTERWSATRQPVDGKTETYQIKNIRWNDPNSDSNPRVSPILVQNENGPCPLVALVNALSLTTPADIPDATLVEVLRSRERVSLDLVLRAVFEELMSPRRTSSEDALPDMGELYEFLQSLHTGMNVNPRFIPTEQMVMAYKRSSLTHLHPTERDALMPGTFENSLEMKLYATFSVPLIHGWLPAKDEMAYSAFERQAASYEDAQNLLFREEELEAKLSDPQGGLSGPEQQLYQDVMAIKMFMNDSATQLTPWGIEVISRAIRPGTFAILFRNDHFSTLYCHPFTMQLLTLVTDAGYSSHEEVVWESLEDVNGEMSELYSGDFRPVGSPNPAGSSSRSNNNDSGAEWTRVQNRRGKDREEEPDIEEAGLGGMASGADHEQEDRDLALALQLQEEEEQKEREEQERRKRESRLSEQFIEQQGRQQPRPVARDRDPRRRTSSSGASLNSPGRSSSSVNVTIHSPGGGGGGGGSGGGRRDSDVAPPPQPPRPQPRPQPQQTQTVRPLVPPAVRPPVSRPAESGEEAPPSYEAAQHDRRYVPGQSSPRPPPGPGGGGGGSGVMPGPGAGPGVGPGAGPGAINQGGPRFGQYPPSNNVGYRPTRPQQQPAGGRMNQGGVGPGARDRDRDCVVM